MPPAASNRATGAATDAEQFRNRIASVFEEYGWSLIGIGECGPASAYHGLGEEVSDAVERVRGNPNARVYATFHYYPSKPA